MRRKRVILTKEKENVLTIPKDIATSLKFPKDVDFNGKVTCCICGKEKSILKTKYIGNGKYRCKIKCKRGNSEKEEK